MAKPLGQVVFKVPELGKQGYQLELQQEARQEKREKERDTEIYRTGGESAFNDNAYKLKGRYLTEAQDLYKEFERVGAMFKQTNDPSLLRKANELSNQIKGVVNDFNTQVGIPLKLAAQADTKQWQGYMGNRDDFDKDMEAVLADVPHKIINNRMHYLWQGEYLPKEQTPWGAGKPNEYNTVMVRETTDLGKYVVPSYYEKGLSSLAENTTNPEHLAQAVSNQFNYDLENIPSLAADVAVAYAIHAGKLSAKNISVSDMQEIIAKYSDPNAPALRTEDKDKNFQTAANDWYRGRLLNISANRYASQSGLFAESATETKEEAPAEDATREQESDPVGVGLPIKTDTKEAPAEVTVEETKREEKQNLDPAGLGLPVVNPPAPTPAERVGMEEASKPPTEVELPRKEEETTLEPELKDVTTLPDTKEGMTETSINVRVATDKKGKSEIINVTRNLPEIYTNNLLDFEGGKSTKVSDPAWADNPTAPVVNGKRVHTNIGVTWNVFESWAKSVGIPKKDHKDRFLNLKPSEALAVAENIAVKKGATNFTEPLLLGMFTQNAWGGGGVYGKASGTEEYKAILSMLKVNGIVPSRTDEVTKEDAAKIEKLFKKNPKKFLDDYFDAYDISHSRMDKIEKDGENDAGFGKNAMVPLYMIYRNGWHNRADKFKEAITKKFGIEYTPMTPYNKLREYQKSVVNGKTVWTLVEKRDGKWTPVGKTDWVDSLQPITEQTK